MGDINPRPLLTKEQADAWEDGWSLAHEAARCGHARANWKDPNWGTPEYKGDEKCEACAAVAKARAEAFEEAARWHDAQRQPWSELAHSIRYGPSDKLTSALERRDHHEESAAAIRAAKDKP